MKRFLIVVVPVIIVVVALVLFLNQSDRENKNSELMDHNNGSTKNENEDKNNKDDNITTARIKLTIDKEEIFITLNDTEASRNFQAMLPLSLTFEDYNNTEKISILPKKLNTSDALEGYDPEIGDFSYYIPWGNISLFYKDFRYSDSLVKLGTIESGMDIITNLTGDFTVKIEKID